MVNVSGSTIVITVSRCMNARVSGMRSATIRSTAPPREQPPGQPLDALRRRALAHPDQHRAAADDEHVAALDGGRRRSACPSDQVAKSASANSGCQR